MTEEELLEVLYEINDILVEPERPSWKIEHIKELLEEVST